MDLGTYRIHVDIVSGQQHIHVARSCRRPDERLDWMYGGGMVAQMDADKRSEQALLGERLPDATDKPDEVCSFRFPLNITALSTC